GRPRGAPDLSESVSTARSEPGPVRAEDPRQACRSGRPRIGVSWEIAAPGRTGGRSRGYGPRPGAAGRPDRSVSIDPDAQDAGRELPGTRTTHPGGEDLAEGDFRDEGFQTEIGPAGDEGPVRSQGAPGGARSTAGAVRDRAPIAAPPGPARPDPARQR